MNQPVDNGISSAAVHSDFLLTNYVDIQKRPLDEQKSHKGGQIDPYELVVSIP